MTRRLSKLGRDAPNYNPREGDIGPPRGLPLLGQWPPVNYTSKGSYVVQSSCQVSESCSRLNVALFRRGDQREKGRQRAHCHSSLVRTVISESGCVCGFVSWGSVFNYAMKIIGYLGSHQERNRQISVIVL